MGYDSKEYDFERILHILLLLASQLSGFRNTSIDFFWIIENLQQ